MAIPIITRTNTIDEWRIQTNQEATALNALETGAYTKSNGALTLSGNSSLVLTANGVSLQVSNNAVFQSDITVEKNIILGSRSSQTGNLTMGATLVVYGVGSALQVANNALVNTDLQVTRTVYTGNISANGNVTVGIDASVARTLRLSGTGDVLYVNTGIAKVNTATITNITSTNTSIANAVIASETVTTSIVVNSNVTTGNIRTLYSNNASITTESVVNSTIVSGNVVTLQSNVATINTLSVGTGTLANANIGVAVITGGATISAVGIATTLLVVGNTTSGNLITSNSTRTGSLTVSNSATIGGTITVTGNSNPGNIVTTGLIHTATLKSTGLATLSDAATVGTTLTVTGNTSSGNLVTTGLTHTGTLKTTGRADFGTVDATGNVTSGNVVTTGLVQTGTIKTTGRVDVGTTLVTVGNTATGNVVSSGLMYTINLKATDTATVDKLYAGATQLSNTTIDGRLTVTGDFVLTGASIIDGDSLILRANTGQPYGTGYSYFGVNRGANANSYIRWNEPAKYWDIRDVDNPTSYSKILTANLISDSVTTVDSNKLASLTAAKTLNDSIATANTNLKAYTDGLNTTMLQRVTGANAAIVTANTSMKSYVDANISIVNQRAVTSGTYANAAYAQANTGVANAATAEQKAVSAGVYANAAFAQANTGGQNGISAGSYANGAFVAANTASVNATSAGSYANSAFSKANTATTNAATADQRAVTSGVYANTSYLHANAAYNAANNSVDLWVRSAANSASSYANSAYLHANSAFGAANTKFASAGGTISGDVNVTGNLTVSGSTTYVNTSVLLVGDAIITLNADIPQTSSPSENAGVEIDRGTSANTLLLWNETTDKWTYTNNGTTYQNIGAESGEIYANAAFVTANSAATSASDLYSIKANIASPTFTGAAYAPTAAVTVNSTHIATTAFVYNVLANTSATYAHNISGTANNITAYTINQSVGTSSGVQFSSIGVNTAPSGNAGEIRATNNITAYYSDDRLKTNLGNITDALARVMKLNGFYYEANQTAQDLGYKVKREVGLSAQQVQAVLPEIVVPAPIDEKYLTIHYDRVVPLLVEAIKELKKEIDLLKKV